MTENKEKILVIKQGALGDIINATGAFSVIRRNHTQDHVVCLTSPLYEKLMKETPYFDEIWCDPRCKGLGPFVQVIQKLRGGHFNRIYDLQGSCRTGWYGVLTKAFTKLQWVGLGGHQKRPAYHALHASSRFAEQLKRGGLDLFGKETLDPDLSWLKVDVSRFQLPSKSILMIPGSSKTGQYKRWPVVFYVELMNRLMKKGYTPVLLGGGDEQDIAQEIMRLCPAALNLIGQTNFFEIAGLAREAVAIVGNDTGPTHLGAAAGCRALFLWSNLSDPAIYAPRGAHISVLYQENLKDLTVDPVEQALEKLMFN